MEILLLILLTLFTSAVYANTAIETETAQIGAQGDIGLSQAYEYANAKDGTSGGTLTQFEYGMTDRSEILIEPFFYVWDHPDGEDKTSGLGDLEITPSYMFVLENGRTPAILAAFKLKVPTGTNQGGGSGEYDYLPYLIFGQHYGDWTFNANLGVNFVTSPDGGPTEHTTTWCLEAERNITPQWTTFWEAYSTEDDVKTANTALQYQWTHQLNTFVALSYTEDNESIIRVGLNLEL